MKISFESKGDFDATRNWLKNVTEGNTSVIVNQIAEEGKASLANNTPRVTGETAAGWQYRITSKGNISEIEWYNTAHPESDVSVAKLIELGHGTRTGGYVPPRHYIYRAMTPVWRSLNKKIKELVK